MKIIKNLVKFSKKVAGSRTAHIFFCIHLIILIIALIQRGDFFPPFHFEYEPLLFNILSTINIPITLITSLILLPLVLYFKALNLEDTYGAILFLVLVMYIGWQIQWALIGYGIEKLFKRL